MPGYGILPADQGSGLLPWDWAMTRLRDSHDYWLATVWPDGRPHTMPVWGAWLEDQLWFSSGLHSRKIRNIAGNPSVSVSTDDARNPVVLAGVAEVVTDDRLLRGFLDATNSKYGTSYDVGFLDPDKNATVRVRPAWVFGLAEDDFGGSPTRWAFAG